jgi:hypothetical protein
MRENNVKSIWKRGGVVINGWLGIPSSISAENMVPAGIRRKAIAASVRCAPTGTAAAIISSRPAIHCNSIALTKQMVANGFQPLLPDFTSSRSFTPGPSCTGVSRRHVRHGFPSSTSPPRLSRRRASADRSAEKPAAAVKPVLPSGPCHRWPTIRLRSWDWHPRRP